MKTIILNHYYPHLTERVMLEVSDEIAVTLSIGGRLCDSYKRRKRDHDECSLDSIPGFEAVVTFPPLTPEQVMETGKTGPSSMRPSANSRPSRPGAQPDQRLH